MKRVLFVDDEPQLLQGLRVSLHSRRKDWDMHFAESSAKAVELMSASHFDVLVTDLRMPGADGITLVARTRTDSPDTIRIVLSGYSYEQQSQHLVSLAHRYLSKPCEPKQLEECIDRCLATQSLIQSAELRARLGSVTGLPSMPATFAALQRALADPAADPSKVAAIIQNDPAISANVMIGLIKLTNYLLDRQLRRLEQDFLHEGGLRERMTRARLAARSQRGPRHA